MRTPRGNQGILTKSEVRSQKSEVVFETEIYAPLQKLCALKGGVLDPTIFDKLQNLELILLDNFFEIA